MLLRHKHNSNFCRFGLVFLSVQFIDHSFNSMADSGGEKNDPKKVESLDDQTQPDKPQVFPTMTGPGN